VTGVAVVDPRTGAVIERLDLLAPGEVVDVGHRAGAAFPAWAATPIGERCRLVAALAAALAARAPEVARAYSREQGKTVDEAGLELARAVEMLEWAAAQAERILRSAPLPERFGLRRSVEAEPAGPVLAIVPWNFPAIVLARKLGPALVTGCPVVVKGAEQTPAVLRAFTAAAADAGLPPDTVRLIFAGPAESQALAGRPEFRHVTFTGSTRVGRLVAASAAANLTACTLELGGHAPAIVTAGADLDLAAARLAAAKFGSAGQSCAAPSRLIVAREVHDEFVDRLVAHAPRLDRDPGPGAAMGPLNNEARRGAVHALVVDAVDRGAEARIGGVRPDGPGFYYPATVLTGVVPPARVMIDEPFGPVAPVYAFDDENEAVAVANGTAYALSACVFGRTGPATAIAGRLDAGSVSVNSAPGAAPDAPLGGRRASGYGYEGGDEGLLAFARLKICQHDPRA
jgi:succinate-semialdehyde dehydrogenase/glutarate-semialdehyde dehydrogenase